MSPLAFYALVLTCAPQVDAVTARALVSVESGFNPYAIGVVGGELERQPRRRSEALATARMLQTQGWNFSIGLAQINVHSLARVGLTVESAFDPCANLTAMQSVLAQCLARSVRASGRQTASQHSLRQALSCYYSGNLTGGFRDGYVNRVLQAAGTTVGPSASSIQTTKEPL